MTVTMQDRIHPKILANAKAWYDEAPTRSAKDTIKLLSGLITEGIPFNQVGALLLTFASNLKQGGMADLIKTARDCRNDPEVKPYLDMSKKVLLPVSSDKASSAEEVKEHRERSALSRYQTPILFGLIGTHIGIFKSYVEGIEQEKGKGVTEESLAKDFKELTGRDLTAEERLL